MNNTIDYLNLFDWWENELSKEEKLILNNSYKPMGASNDGLEAERVFQLFKTMGYYSSSSSPVDCLSGIAGYVSARENFDLKIKL